MNDIVCLHLCLVGVVIFVEAINPIVGEKVRCFQVISSYDFGKVSNPNCASIKSILFSTKKQKSSFSEWFSLKQRHHDRCMVKRTSRRENTKTTKMNRDKTSFSIGKSKYYRKNAHRQNNRIFFIIYILQIPSVNSSKLEKNQK